MVADSAKRQFQGVVVYQLDRFARNRYDSATHKARLKKNGVKVLSARENISDDASGVLMEAVLEGMAEYFSAELSQKVKRGMKLNAEKCLYTGSGVPLGYKVANKKFAIDDDTAYIVRRVFEMYLAGKTMADIIRYLNGNGIKTNRGNPYNKNMIRRILTNERYIGTYIYGDVKIPKGIPCIIDDHIFEQTQIQMEKNKKAPARAKAVEDYYLLTTKLYCGHCQSAITGYSGTSHTSKFYQYYGCVTQRRRNGKCSKKSLQKNYIEDLVVKSVLSALTDEYIDLIANKIAELSAKDGNTDNLKRLKKLIRENEAATANLVKAVESGKAVDVFSAQIEKRQAEKAELEAELAKEKMIRPILTYDEIKYFFEKFKDGDISDQAFRSALVDTFISRIYLYDGDDPRIEIHCNASDKALVVPAKLSNNKPLGEPLRGSSKGHLRIRYNYDKS